MEKQYVVKLTSGQEGELVRQLRGRLSARERARRQTLLLAAQGETDEEIADQVGISLATVARSRKRFAQHGLQAAVHERPRPGKPAKLDGKAETLLVALAWSPAPQGHPCWTACLLVKRLGALQVVEQGSEDTGLRVLKKTRLSPGRNGRGACPRA
jgi:transposase